MIVIDKDMPKNCVECEIECKHKVTAHIRYSREQFSIPQDCPIKCDIEDIKKDIKQEIVDIVCEESSEGEPKWCAGLGYSLKIIDKYIRGAE